MIVSKEKLDELFGISHYSYETIKNRRSYIINCLNKNTIIKIERVRNDRDKRFFDYKIN
jgi:ribosomal protein S26